MTAVFLSLSEAQVALSSAIRNYECLSQYQRSLTSTHLLEKLQPQFSKIRQDLITHKFQPFSDLPITKIKAHSELTLLDPIQTNGVTSKGLAYTAVYKNQKVFLKKLSQWSLKTKGFTEIHWLYYLNKLGVGIKLIGYCEIAGETHLITEYIEGIDNKELASSDEIKKYLTPFAVSVINQHKLIFQEIGIYAEDLQFIFSSQGKVTLIDPEGFSLLGGKYVDVDPDDKAFSEEPFHDFFNSLKGSSASEPQVWH